MTPRPFDPGPLTPAQLEIWADRIAGGRDAFPADLPAGDRQALEAAVRRRLRQRLLRHVARAIADRIANATESPPPRSGP